MPVRQTNIKYNNDLYKTCKLYEDYDDTCN